jgi:hypothetical protein
VFSRQDHATAATLFITENWFPLCLFRKSGRDSQCTKWICSVVCIEAGSLTGFRGIVVGLLKPDIELNITFIAESKLS